MMGGMDEEAIARPRNAVDLILEAFRNAARLLLEECRDILEVLSRAAHMFELRRQYMAEREKTRLAWACLEASLWCLYIEQVAKGREHA